MLLVERYRELCDISSLLLFPLSSFNAARSTRHSRSSGSRPPCWRTSTRTNRACKRGSLGPIATRPRPRPCWTGRQSCSLGRGKPREGVWTSLAATRRVVSKKGPSRNPLNVVREMFPERVPLAGAFLKFLLDEVARGSFRRMAQATPRIEVHFGVLRLKVEAVRQTNVPRPTAQKRPW